MDNPLEPIYELLKKLTQEQLNELQERVEMAQKRLALERVNDKRKVKVG